MDACSGRSSANPSALAFFIDLYKRPKFTVKKIEVAPTPTSTRKSIYFRIENSGRSTASNCKAILKLPSEVKSNGLGLTKQRIKLGDEMVKHDLDWFEPSFAEYGGPLDEKKTLGKKHSLDPDDVLLMGTIWAEPRGPVNGVQLSILVEDAKADNRETAKMVPLNWLGEAFDIKLELKWVRAYAGSSTHHFHVEVKSFSDICFTEFSDC